MEEMTEVLIAGNILKNPNTSKEQKETAQQTIDDIKEKVNARVQSLLVQRKRRRQ